VFLADFERSELYQNGQRVKVQAKLFQALVLLLRRAGDVVSREEVRRQLWPENYLINLDANVNTRSINCDKSWAILQKAPCISKRFLAGLQLCGHSGILRRSNEAPLEMANKKSAEAKHASGIEPVLSDRRFYVAARVVSLLFGA